MNEQTTQLLEQLAAKLGTTAEYLWIVLVRQAPVTSTVDLLLYVALLLCGYGLYRLHRYFSKETESYDSLYEESEGACQTIIVVASVTWVIAVIMVSSSLPVIISGFFNPEYWALKEVLNSIK